MFVVLISIDTWGEKILSILATALMSNTIKDLMKSFKEVKLEKKTYTDKLELATGNDVFKYLLLINTSAQEGYVIQTRLQAEQSFQLSKFVAIMGFLMLIISIAIGIYSTITGTGQLDAAYLAAIAGIIVEFISGVFFYLYNRTLQQLNLFHNKMVSTQYISLSLLTNSHITDPIKQDESKVALANTLMSLGVGD